MAGNVDQLGPRQQLAARLHRRLLADQHHGVDVTTGQVLDLDIGEVETGTGDEPGLDAVVQRASPFAQRPFGMAPGAHRGIHRHHRPARGGRSPHGTSWRIAVGTMTTGSNDSATIDGNTISANSSANA